MPPSTKEEYRGFLDTEYFERGVMQPADVVGGGHCLTPRYIEDQIERFANRSELGILERALREHRGVAGGEKQLVALAEGDLELFGYAQDDVGAGL